MPVSKNSDIVSVLDKYQGFTPFELGLQENIQFKFFALQEEIFGAVREENNEQVVIYLSSNEDDKRQIFNAAHELGHCFLHRGYLKEGILCYRQKVCVDNISLEIKRELEADAFALQMLMPEDLVKMFLNKTSFTNIKDLLTRTSYFFSVPLEIVDQRLNDLGLL